MNARPGDDFHWHAEPGLAAQPSGETAGSGALLVAYPSRASGELSAPQEIETERGLLAALILDATQLEAATLAGLEPEHFAADNNRRIYEAMKAEAESEGGFDLPSIKARLRREGTLQLPSDYAYLASLIEGWPVHMSVQSLAGRIKKAAYRRSMHAAADRLAKASVGGESWEIEAGVRELNVLAQAEFGQQDSKFSRLEEGNYELRRGAVTLRLERLCRERGQLIGDLVVECSIPGVRTVGGCLSVGRLNISSPSARMQHARTLAELARTTGPDWRGLLEEISQWVIGAEREGVPSVSLAEIPLSAPEEALEIHGLRLFPRHPVIWFGDGGSLKSFLALYVAGTLAQRGLRVGLFDWELSQEDHAFRLQRMFGERPDIRYVRCQDAFVHEADRLAKVVRDDALDYVILDSIAFACDGPPEAAEVASRYFQALRRLGSVGSLHNAHVTKSEGADAKPFGSAFWHNGARDTSNVKATPTRPGEVEVRLFNRKANLGPLRPPVGMAFRFQGHERVEVNPVKLNESSSTMSAPKRMAQALRGGPMAIDELATEIGANVDTVRRNISRYRDRFTDLGDGRLSLTEQQE